MIKCVATSSPPKLPSSLSSSSLQPSVNKSLAVVGKHGLVAAAPQYYIHLFYYRMCGRTTNKRIDIIIAILTTALPSQVPHRYVLVSSAHCSHPSRTSTQVYQPARWLPGQTDGLQSHTTKEYMPQSLYYYRMVVFAHVGNKMGIFLLLSRNSVHHLLLLLLLQPAATTNDLWLPTYYMTTTTYALAQVAGRNRGGVCLRIWITYGTHCL